MTAVATKREAPKFRARRDVRIGKHNYKAGSQIRPEHIAEALRLLGAYYIEPIPEEAEDKCADGPHTKGADAEDGEE